MLGMGMTLTFDDLRSALAMPKELLAGFVLQYSVSYTLILFSLPNVLFHIQNYKRELNLYISFS